MRGAGAGLTWAWLVACAPAPPAGEDTAVSATIDVALLSPAGYGALRLGMTPDEAGAALGSQLIADGAESPADCETYHLEPGVEPQGMRFLARNGRLARIDEYGSEGVATPEGIAVGVSAIALRGAYPGAVKEPSDEDSDASMLTVWTVPQERGYRFHNGRVSAIGAGDRNILLREGCS